MNLRTRQLGGMVCLLGLLPLALAGCDDTASSSTVALANGDAQPSASHAAAAPSDTAPSAAPAAEPSPAPAAPLKTKDVTFDTIKLALEKDQPFDRSLLTPEVLAIHEKPIRIRGYMLPSFQQSGLTQFVLVRDNLECCFGPGAALHDCIVVEMQGGATADFSVRPVAVEGVFSIRELEGIDGKHLAIYHLDGESVE